MAVLKANHLASAKAVAKKAQTIMKQADADGSGTLTLSEFLVVAKKFPNLVGDVVVRIVLCRLFMILSGMNTRTTEHRQFVYSAVEYAAPGRTAATNPVLKDSGC